MKDRLSPYIIIVISIVFVFISQILFKEVSSNIQFNGISFESVFHLLNSLFENKYYWLALLAFGCSTVLWLIGLKSLPLSQAFSFTSLNYIFIALYSYLVIKEEFSLAKSLSSVFITIGIILINKKNKKL